MSVRMTGEVYSSCISLQIDFLTQMSLSKKFTVLHEVHNSLSNCSYQICGFLIIDGSPLHFLNIVLLHTNLLILKYLLYLATLQI